jgi:DNA polymerase-2
VNEYTGWLLDLYPHPERGIVLWLIGDDGRRRCLRQDFPVTFYAAGPAQRLRDLWIFLQNQPSPIELSRTERRDLMTGATVVLAATLDSPSALPGLFQTLAYNFPDLAFYDADLHVALRHAAVYGTFPFARCHVAADEGDVLHEIKVLDSRWDVDVEAVPLRILTVEPDTDPLHTEPGRILLRTKQGCSALDLKDGRSTLAFLGYLLNRLDPDLILTSHGDTWLLPLLLKLSEQHDRPLPWNRDPDGEIGYRKERSYFAYNQVIYRGGQIHLAGRLHIDIHNTVMYHDYGMDGVLEMARVTSLPIQTAARVSPGTGISAMQIVTALENEILVPLRKEQVERPKTTSELFHEDMGGTVYDPIIGLHDDVGEIDFFSMYPSIMVRFNISPETVGSEKRTVEAVAGLESVVKREALGLIPQTLAPLLEKRFKLKSTLLTLSRLDCRYKNYKARTAAHKWLLVTCFGYLGYKNARFGRIEAHEAVTAFGREVLLRAKESAEELGFRVLHLYVDGMWVQKPGCKTARDFQPLLDDIKTRTGLPIALEGVYKWVAFLASRSNKKIAVPNRYFGVFQNGEIKTRGIETRRHDTPAFIRETQTEILEMLAQAPDREGLNECLPGIRAVIRDRQNALRLGRVPPEKLIVRQTISRNLDEYRAPVPAFSALQELERAGKSLRPGQTIRLIYTLGSPRARAWDAETDFDPRTVNIPRYRRLLDRAVDAVLEPITGTPGAWLAQAVQLDFDHVPSPVVL